MIFLRHPTPDIDKGICYGQTNMDIAKIGYSQIEQALKTTPKITKLIASPALRCKELATRLCAREKIDPIFDPKLWEMNMGDFEGVRWDKMDRAVSDKWLEDPMHNPTPKGEAFIDLQSRVLKTVNFHTNNMSEEEQKCVAFVCHAGPIRALKMAWEDFTFKQAFEFFPDYATPLEIFPKK